MTPDLVDHRLREARLAAGLTQTALAERLGCPISVVNRWERGHVEPGLTNALKIARALDTTVDAIWGFDNKRGGAAPTARPVTHQEAVPDECSAA